MKEREGDVLLKFDICEKLTLKTVRQKHRKGHNEMTSILPSSKMLVSNTITRWETAFVLTEYFWRAFFPRA